MTAIFFSLVLLVAALSLGFFYMVLVRKLDHISKAQDFIKKRLSATASGLMHHAHKKSLSIIEDANQEAQEILGEAKFVDEQSKVIFEKKLAELFENQVASLGRISQELIGSYREAIAKLGSEESMALKDISESMKEEGLREIGAFKNVLEQETVASQKVVEQMIAQEYGRVRGEIEAYRQEMLKKVDAQMYAILQTVSKQVLGKALTPSEHEELVLQALDEAKRQGVLSNGK